MQSDGERLLSELDGWHSSPRPMAGLTDGSQARGTADFSIPAPSDTIKSTWAAMTEAMRPAGVLYHRGQPELIVATSRLAAVWLLRKLVSSQKGLTDGDWAELALVADAADRQTNVAGGEEATGGASGQDGEEGEEGEEGDEDEDEPATTQQKLDAAGLGTQEQQDWRDWNNGRKDFQRTLQASKPGATVATVTNNIRTAERKRKRKRDAEAAVSKRRQVAGPKSDEFVVESSISGGSDDGRAPSRIPRPSKNAGQREIHAWERLNQRGERLRRLIIQVKEDLEGKGSDWRERPVPRSKPGRPSKGAGRGKVMSYSVADKWLERAESVCREEALGDLVAALKTRAAPGGEGAPITDAQRPSQPARLPSSGGQTQSSSGLGVEVVPASNQEQQQAFGAPSRLSAQKSIERLRAAASRVQDAHASVALAVVQERLRKAFLANVYDEATEAIKAERIQSGQKQVAGPSGHARFRAKEQMEEAFADDPAMWQLLQKQISGARRWQRLGERLGYGAILMSGQYELPNNFVEKELNELEFAKWLELASEVHADGLRMGHAVWEHVGGPAMMESGDFSFRIPDPDALQHALILAVAASQRSAASGVSYAQVTEVHDTDSAEDDDEL